MKKVKTKQLTLTDVRQIVKEEFFKRMNEFSDEIQKVRTEQELHTGQHTHINDRFDRIDTHLRIHSAS